MFSAVDMEQDWPLLPTYSKGYLKREKFLKEKTLVDVKKRVKQTERMIKPAMQNATAVSSTAKHAQESADAVAKVGYAETHMYSKNKSGYIWQSCSAKVSLSELCKQDILFSKSLNHSICQ